MNDWQPIETAPKDGTRMILRDQDGERLGYYSHRHWRDAMTPLYIFVPTHWKPITEAK